MCSDMCHLFHQWSLYCKEKKNICTCGQKIFCSIFKYFTHLVVSDNSVWGHWRAVENELLNLAVQIPQTAAPGNKSYKNTHKILPYAVKRFGSNSVIDYGFCLVTKVILPFESRWSPFSGVTLFTRDVIMTSLCGDDWFKNINSRSSSLPLRAHRILRMPLGHSASNVESSS